MYDKSKNALVLLHVRDLLKVRNDGKVKISADLIKSINDCFSEYDTKPYYRIFYDPCFIESEFNDWVNTKKSLLAFKGELYEKTDMSLVKIDSTADFERAKVGYQDDNVFYFSSIGVFDWVPESIKHIRLSSSKTEIPQSNTVFVAKTHQQTVFSAESREAFSKFLAPKSAVYAW